MFIRCCSSCLHHHVHTQCDRSTKHNHNVERYGLGAPSQLDPLVQDHQAMRLNFGNSSPRKDIIMNLNPCQVRPQTRRESTASPPGFCENGHTQQDAAIKACPTEMKAPNTPKSPEATSLVVSHKHVIGVRMNTRTLERCQPLTEWLMNSV